MKIVYFADKYNKRLPILQIKEALQNLKHKVIIVDSTNFEMPDLMKKAEDCDLFLFHRGGVNTDDRMNFELSLKRLEIILAGFKCKKVMWFIDKVWELGENMVETIVPQVDHAFFNDGNWVRRNKYPNISTLHMAAQKRELGKYDKELDADVAIVGQIYGERQKLVDELTQIYGNRFIAVDNCFGEDFDNLCQSVKVIIEPDYPLEDFYWTDRIYRTLASGGLFLARKLYGRTEFEPNKEYIEYKGMEDLAYHLKWFTRDSAKEEADVIRRRGREAVRKKSTYEHRLKEIFKTIKK